MAGLLLQQERSSWPSGNDLKSLMFFLKALAEKNVYRPSTRRFSSLITPARVVAALSLAVIVEGDQDLVAVEPAQPPDGLRGDFSRPDVSVY